MHDGDSQISGADRPFDSPDHELAQGRREFLKTLAVALPAVGANLDWTHTAQPRTVPSGPDGLVGIQMGPHTMCDEGIDRVLDLIQDTAAINTLFIYSHAYGGDLRKQLNVLATDHGVPPRDQRTRKLPLVWVKQHDQYFKDTSLRHPKVDVS